MLSTVKQDFFSVPLVRLREKMKIANRKLQYFVEKCYSRKLLVGKQSKSALLHNGWNIGDDIFYKKRQQDEEGV